METLSSVWAVKLISAADGPDKTSDLAELGNLPRSIAANVSWRRLVFLCALILQEANLKQESQWLFDRAEEFNPPDMHYRLPPIIILCSTRSGLYVPYEAEDLKALRHLSGLNALTEPEFENWQGQARLWQTYLDVRSELKVQS